tara:strand:+ start:493 stop:912 length:420 start_codon:yes stop_codon:yes gene_type:complete
MKKSLLVLATVATLFSCTPEEQAEVVTQDDDFSIINNYILVKKESKRGDVITPIEICNSPWTFAPERYLFIFEFSGESCDLENEYYMRYTNTSTSVNICDTSGNCVDYKMEPYSGGGLKLTSTIDDFGVETIYYLILMN